MDPQARSLLNCFHIAMSGYPDLDDIAERFQRLAKELTERYAGPEVIAGLDALLRARNKFIMAAAMAATRD
jgi:hypothetical protein